MHDVTYQLIKAMHALCTKNGASFALVSVPMNAESRAFLQKIADQARISYLALDAHFESAPTRGTFPHDRHWNASGHEIAANAIDAFLRESGVFNASR
jgi:hypothetical protein